MKHIMATAEMFLFLNISTILFIYFRCLKSVNCYFDLIGCQPIRSVLLLL